jgi:apolipoprotein N-acyltransferase
VSSKISLSIKNSIIEIGVIILAALLFALSFPSFISNTGWGFLGFIAIFPIFYLFHRVSYLKVIIYGAIFGFLSYTFFAYWLATFHPLAIFIVPTVFATHFIIGFPLFKLADRLFPKYSYLVQAIIWVGIEYFRSLGFAGYAYGIIGYTQYLFTPFIQIAEFTGVWGISLLVIIPSAFIGNAFKHGISKDGLVWMKNFIKTHKIDTIIYASVFVLVIIFGFFIQVDYTDSRKWKVALIQQNDNPWKSTVEEYRKNLDFLIQLSQEAMKEDPEIIVWSETAFVPSIDWHTKYRTSQKKYKLVKRLMEYLESQEIPYLIGNNDGQRKSITSDERLDYNATVHYENGKVQNIYRKIHLVPFTESFPFKDLFPWIYKALKEADTHFWEKGTEYTVFNSKGVKFSTPICFEDTFGYLSRNFIKAGADVIVNVTNDSWSGAVSSEVQHMGMAVFRTVENKRSMVRSANGGITCIIDPNGKILKELEPFVAGYLVGDVPVYNQRVTIYELWGDYFGVLAMIVSIMLLLGKGLYTIIMRKMKNQY